MTYARLATGTTAAPRHRADLPTEYRAHSHAALIWYACLPDTLTEQQRRIIAEDLADTA